MVTHLRRFHLIFFKKCDIHKMCIFVYIYMFNNDIKKYRLIKGCDLQLYEGVAFSPTTSGNSESQTEEDSFEY